MSCIQFRPCQHERASQTELKRVSFHTLGCRLNQAETARAANDLAANGYSIVPFGADAEIVVINSCAVTGTASQKTRQAVRMARRRHPDAFIVLMGCDAKVDSMAWEDSGVDLVVPHPADRPLSRLLEGLCIHGEATSFAPCGDAKDDFSLEGEASFNERTRANLKVQDGCSFFCSYCIVPYARSPARPQPWLL